jgi:uncharacterized protein (TIGR04222 family)
VTDFWPLNMEPGLSFLAFYFVFSVAVLASTAAIVNGILRRSDEHALLAAAAARGASATSPGSYREAQPPPQLTLGRIPQPEEYWAIAYLRGGNRAVRDLLLCAAIAEGWLRDGGEPGAFVFLPHVPPTDAVLHRLYAAMPGDGSGATAQSVSWQTAGRLASRVAEEKETDLHRRIDAAGLARAPDAGELSAGALLVAGGFVVAVGFARLVRGIALAHKVGFLFLELVGVGLATAVLAHRFSKGKSTAANDYLRWLDGATQSLQSDVIGGRRNAPQEITLAAAIAGAAAVSSGPVFRGIEAFFRPAPNSSDGSGSSGCGGGGCGGCGGGCGG